MTDWQPMDIAPRDRLILIHCANSKSLPVKVGRWLDGWIHSVSGTPIKCATGWVAIPDWSMQKKIKPMDKKIVFSDRDLSIWKRRKAGETNEAIGKSYKITKGRVSQIFKRTNKNMFDMP